ncbi:MAG: hypothetical protein HKO94_10865 [Flavobacteriaceae bacterium]|nr:hypothetical protein [Flavobacteriaceae bacterium]
MMSNLYKQSLILLIPGIFLMSCVAEEGPIIVETEDEEPLTVSFAADIQPIFTNNCIQCHDETHPTGLNLQEGSSYNLLVNVSSNNYSPNLRIEPFSTENSVLWHKINNDGVFGGGMPPNGSLSNFEKQKIEEWILQGAQDN